MVDTRRTGNSAKHKADGSGRVRRSRRSSALNDSEDRYGEYSDQEGSDYTPEKGTRKARRVPKDSNNSRSSDGGNNHRAYRNEKQSRRRNGTRESRTPLRESENSESESESEIKDDCLNESDSEETDEEYVPSTSSRSQRVSAPCFYTARSSRKKTINYNEESSDGEDCIGHVGLNGSKKKLDSGLDDSTKSDDREDTSSPKLTSENSSKEEDGEMAECGGDGEMAEEDDGEMAQCDGDEEIAEEDIDMDDEDGDEEDLVEDTEGVPVIALDDCSLDNNKVKVELVNEESCDRPRKRRRDEVEDLLRSQGRDPSEAANFNTGPEIYHNIKRRTRQKKLFFDEDGSDHQDNVSDQHDNDTSQNEDGSDQQEIETQPRGLRRSQRKRNIKFEDDIAYDDDDDEAKEPTHIKKNYYLRKRKPQAACYESYYQQHDDDRFMRRNRNRHYPRHARGSPHKSRDARSDSDDGRRRDDEAKARCVPINFTAADFQTRGLEHSGASGSTSQGKEIGVPVGLDPNITFASIGGLCDVMKKLTETVRLPMQYPEFFKRFHLKPQKGLLFHGLPGTGKTHLARALANECSKGGRKVAFIHVKGSDMMSKWFGDSERQIRALFERAHEFQPSIIFFDEIDGIAPRRSNNQESDGNAYNSLVSALLTAMDGLKPCNGVLVIGATNRVDAIDPALRRPGRFDREFHFPLPNKEARKAILKIHTSKWVPPVGDNLLEWLADRTDSYCGADIKGLCTEAALLALQRKYPQIYNSDEKLKIEVDDIQVKQKHFMKAMKLVTPASQRFEASKSRPLCLRIAPLLENNVKNALLQFSHVYPEVKKKSKTLREEEENSKTMFENAVYSSLQDNPNNPLTDVDMNDDSDDLSSEGEEMSYDSVDDGHNSEYLLSELSVYRPRMLMFGGKGSGLVSHIAPAFLSDLEGVSVHILSTAGIFGGSIANGPEYEVKEIIRQATKSSPSVVYLPDLENFIELSSESLLGVLENELNNIPSNQPVLLLGVLQKATVDSVSDGVCRFFPERFRENFVVTSATAEERERFFHPIFMDLARRKPRIRALRKLKKSRVVLEKVHPESSKLSQEQLGEIIKKEEAILLKQRQFLRKFLVQFTSDSTFKHFRYPVNARDVPDYYKVITNPMDFDTMMRKIDQGCYWNNQAFLDDFSLICKNALEYNPRSDTHSRSIIHSASVLADTVHDEMNSKKVADLEKACEWVISSRTSRGIPIHTPSQPIINESQIGDEMNLDSSGGSIPLMPKAKRQRRSKWSKGIYKSVKRRPKIVNGDSRKSSELHPDMECSVDRCDLFDNNTEDCNDDDDERRRVDDEGEEFEFDNSVGGFDDFPLKPCDADSKNISLTAQCGDESLDSSMDAEPEDQRSFDHDSNKSILYDEDEIPHEILTEELPKSELISEETRGYGLVNNESGSCNEESRSSEPPNEDKDESDVNLDDTAGGSNHSCDHIAELNEDIKESSPKSDAAASGDGEKKEVNDEEKTCPENTEESALKEDVPPPPPIPQPPPLVVNDEKLVELHKLCVEKTAEFDVEELEQIFSYLCRIVYHHNKNFDKTDLLQELEQAIVSLVE